MTHLALDLAEPEPVLPPAQPLQKKATDLPFKGLDRYKRPQDSGQDGMLIDPGFKSTRQAGLVDLGEPSSKIVVSTMDLDLQGLKLVLAQVMSHSSPCMTGLGLGQERCSADLTTMFMASAKRIPYHTFHLKLPYTWWLDQFVRYVPVGVCQVQPQHN